MEDNIELVIKIPKGIYVASQMLDVKHEDTVQIPLEIIANGTPLPKGHGRLIDEDKIWDKVPDISSPLENHFKTYDFCRFLANTPTVIEADKNESEVYRMINYKMVSHPSHYNLEGKKECIELMREDYGETITAVFCLTNAYKYLYRAGNKGSREEDIAKAGWYWEYFKDIEDKVVFDRYLNRLVEKIEEVLECEDR